MCLLCRLKKAFQEMLQTSVTGAAVRVELYLQSSADFEKAKSLIDRAFDES